jgi:murein DD-endopeptidase MepM/ murein hydrolase activator NlpD
LAEDEILQIVDLLQDETGQLWLRVSGEDAPPPGWLSARGHECATPSDEPPAGQVKTCGQVTEPFRFAWPVPDYPSIERTYGVAVDYQDCGFHTGIDIAAPTGKPIVAVAQGKVVHVGPMWFDRAGAGRGPYAVIIEHQPGKMYSTYGHNSRALVSLGQCVAKGQVIAEIGSLGHSTGPHLHFEMVMNRPFSGNWRVPFHDVCVKKTPFAPQSAYRSPDPQALTYDP